MKLPDFCKDDPLNRLKDQMGIPRDTHGGFPKPCQDTQSSAPVPQRAYVLLKSGRRLDLLNPQPDAWTDEDLAIGLSRTNRWGGYSKWDLPLSVAQHSLAVLALAEANQKLTPREALRELLHDATEPLMGWDPITSIKPHLGPQFRQLDERLQAAVDRRYALPAWTPDSYTRHKQADRLAAAIEAYHTVGWSLEDMRESLGIMIDPRNHADPLTTPPGMKPWEPWPPKLAAKLVLERLTALLAAAKREEIVSGITAAFHRLPAWIRAGGVSPAGTIRAKSFVRIEASDGSHALDGIIVDGPRNEDGSFDLAATFTLFTTNGNPDGRLTRCKGSMYHVENL